MTRAILMLILMVLLVPLVMADYPHLGGDNYDYVEGDGNWNDNLDTSLVQQSSRTITSQRATPLVSDLDGDGTKEIVYVNGADLVLFQDIDLSVVASETVGSDEYISNILLYDIDGDGNPEVVYSQESSRQIVIGDWNGTALTTTTIGWGGTVTHNDGETVIGCKDTNDCLIAVVEDDSATANVRIMRGVGFNSTALTTSGQTLISSTGSGVGGREGQYCFPKLKTVDSTDDVWTFSHALFKNQNQGGGTYYVTEVSRSGTTLSTSTKASRSESILNIASSSFNCKTDTLGNYISAVTKGELYGTSSGKEFHFAISEDTDDFKLYTYSNAGSLIDDHPEASTSNGILISNPILMNGIDDTDLAICVAGFDKEAVGGGQLELVCGNQDSFAIDTAEYELTGIASDFNITESYGSHQPLVHAVQTTGSTDSFHEIITPYGVMQLIDTALLPTSLQEIYDIDGETGVEDAVWLPIDYQGVDLFDLIGLSSTNIYYLDDGFTNSPAQISSYSINPCIDAIWQVNTSVNVQITVEDTNSDQVSAKSVLYADELTEIDNGYSFNASSGTTFNFNFVANETTSNSILRLLGRDVENPLEEDEIELSYTVATQGVEYGDCQTTVTVEGVTEDETLQEQLGISEDNAIITGITQIDEDTGLGLGTTMIWLIFMLVVAYVVISSSGLNGNTKIGALVIAEFSMLVLGALLGFFSTALIVTISIPIILIVVVIGAKFFIGARN